MTGLVQLLLRKQFKEHWRNLSCCEVSVISSIEPDAFSSLGECWYFRMNIEAQI